MGLAQLRVGLKAWIAAFLLGLAACGKADPLKGMQRGESGRVVRVIDGDALVLDSGLSVRLAGIEAPAGGGREREPQPYAQEAARVLESLAMGREVTLYYGGLSRDRYGRAIAQARTSDGYGPAVWLNAAMVREGAARVRIYPDNEDLAGALLSAEDEARTQRAGLWSVAAYALRDAGSVEPGETGFEIAEGWLVPAAQPSEKEGEKRGEGRSVACFLAVGRIMLELGPGAAQRCATPPGSRVRVRGYLRDGLIRIDSAPNLEILAPPGG